MGKPEAQLQISVCQHLDVILPSDATYWASLNERNVTKSTGAYVNRMGRKSGVADLLVLHAGRLIAIELKTDNNPIRKTRRTYQSANQKDWQADVERCGGFYAVCRSIEDVSGTLRGFGVPIREKTHT